MPGLVGNRECFLQYCDYLNCAAELLRRLSFGACLGKSFTGIIFIFISNKWNYSNTCTAETNLDPGLKICYFYIKIIILWISCNLDIPKPKIPTDS